MSRALDVSGENEVAEELMAAVALYIAVAAVVAAQRRVKFLRIDLRTALVPSLSARYN